MNTLWELWWLALALLAGVFWVCEHKAAMRGTHREPLPKWQDKMLRMFFFWWLVSPLCIALGWVFVAVCMLYLPSYLDGSEKSGTRDEEWMRSSRLWLLFKKRMNLRLVYKEKLDPKKQYIIGLHPHGILPWGGAVNCVSTHCGGPDWMNGVDIRFLAASFAFYLPLYRDLLLYSGGLDAARYNAVYTLSHGKSLMLVPGGATEALYAYPKVNTLVLRKRRGFIKLALETGAYLVPVYSFNENDAYNQLADDLPFVKSLKQKFQKIFGLSLPLITNIIPRSCNVTTVIGEPIKVDKAEEPTEEQVDKVLDQYIAAMEKLFEENAEKYGSPNNLVIL